MKKTSRRRFGKQLTWALGAIPVVSLAAKTGKGQEKKKLAGDPITVGGGGGPLGGGGKRPTRILPYCTFDHEKYTSKDSGDKKLFKHTVEATHMTSLVVAINGDTFNLDAFLPADGECKLTVYCADGESFQVWGDKNERMRIKLHTKKYPATGNTHQSTDTGNYINRIVVDTPLGWFERVELAVNDVVGIEAGTN